MLATLFAKAKRLEMSVRSCFWFMGAGLGVEALVIMLHMVIKHYQRIGASPFGFYYSTWFAANSVVGFLGTLLLTFGMVCLIRALRISRAASSWGYISVVSIITFKMLDIVYSMHLFSLEDSLGVPFDVDEFLLNFLLIVSAATLLIAMARALIDLHRAEATLAEQRGELIREITERRLLATAIENAAESILITDAGGVLQYVNPAFERITGFQRDQALGRTPALLKSGLHDEAFYRELWATIRAGKVWRGRFQNKRCDGTFFMEEATISAIQDEKGAITHYVAVKHDITREKQLEQQVQQSQKLEAVGTLAGGIAHDLNNVLAVIIGHSEMSMDKLERDHPVRKSLEVIVRTAHRSSQLIKRLLIFSRQGAAEPGPMAPAQLVGEQMKIIRSYLPSNITISDAIDKDAGIIMSEPIEVQQIVFNLCTNANHAMQPADGALEIGMDCVTIEEERTAAAGKLVPGNYVRLYVRDDGCGMDADIQRRIFDPFFTTKDVGMGTGLGLSMVHGSIMRAGGAIDVTSAPGTGTRFDLYWPRIAHAPVEEQPARDIPDGGGRTVLVVDDIADFEELVEINLTVHGFKTVGFTDAAEALAYFGENADAVDIALVDYMMPTMNGVALAEQLHGIKPDLPMVLMSGYSCFITQENAREHGFHTVLNKPVETAHLIETLLACLENR